MTYEIRPDDALIVTSHGTTTHMDALAQDGSDQNIGIDHQCLTGHAVFSRAQCGGSLCIP